MVPLKLLRDGWMESSHDCCSTILLPWLEEQEEVLKEEESQEGEEEGKKKWYKHLVRLNSRILKKKICEATNKT